MPNRILKESITTSREIDMLTAEEERLFYRLIVVCDDFGRMDARASVIRARCFPLKIDTIKDEDIVKWMDSLVDAGLIIVYAVDDRPYLQMVTWEKHQQRRAKYSKYPSSDGDEELLNSDDEEETKTVPVPFGKIKDIYNTICVDLPKIKMVSSKRKKHIRARWNQYGADIAVFEELFTKVAESSFLTGNNDRKWKASFDWLMNENNMTKVLEGKYVDADEGDDTPPYWRD